MRWGRTLEVGAERMEEEGGDARRQRSPELVPIRLLVQLVSSLPTAQLGGELAEVVAEESGVHLRELLGLERVEEQEQALQPAKLVDHDA